MTAEQKAERAARDKAQLEADIRRCDAMDSPGGRRMAVEGRRLWRERYGEDAPF